MLKQIGELTAENEALRKFAHWVIYEHPPLSETDDWLSGYASAFRDIIDWAKVNGVAAEKPNATP